MKYDHKEIEKKWPAFAKATAGKQTMIYAHRKIERKWQTKWEEEKLYRTLDEKKGADNYYTLVEFPYPSGNLHVGHWYAFSVPDIFARMKRMQGYNMLFPIGFDAFGLPAENAALSRGLNPRKWTYDNIEYMRGQLRTMGASFDWSREVVTCDPGYYHWTQWLFLQFFKKGLAYQAETAVNWCPSCKTVLANEQVIQGRCERCDHQVEQRQMKQWLLRITDFAEKLLDGLQKLDWPEEIKESQRNWIGKSEGAEIEFPVVIPAPEPESRTGSRIKSGMTEIKRFVLLHGRGGSPRKNFLPWLKMGLEARGFEVFAPSLPNPEEPDDIEQAEFVKSRVPLDEQTVIVGHSFGGVVALRLLEGGAKFTRVVLVGTPYSGKFLDGKVRASVTRAVKKGFDFKKIQKQARDFVALYDTRDYVVPMSDGESFAKKLNAVFIKTQARAPHFTSEEEQAILEICLPLIKVFTTRPDTLFGATYMVLAPEHELISKIKNQISNIKEVEEYIAKTKKKTELQRTALEKEKTGVELKGMKAINPATEEEIPIWMADYVLMGYGTGAIMAVPAHDERDFEFAKKFKLPIKKVIKPPEVVMPPAQPPEPAAWGHLDADLEAECWAGDGTIINSGKFNGRQSNEVRWQMAEFVGGERRMQYKFRDWLISRQRYWGAPIPIIHCEKCGAQPISEKELPVRLPEIKDYKPRGDGKSPLAKVENWVKVKCPVCGGRAERETDTMDTFIDSSWYFLRYTDPKNKKTFAARTKMRNWMPVDRYSGGAEHTTMHLLYSRFWIKAMYDLGLLEWDEPYILRMNRGLILGPDGQKMSKSRGNVVNPDKYVRELGADTVRMYLAFIGPYNEVGAYPWDPKGITGIRRFLEKVWRLASDVIASKAKQSQEKGEIAARPAGARNDTKIGQILHKTIQKVTEDIEAFKFNTAISALMILVNAFSTSSNDIGKEHLETFLKLLAPFAPHIAEELWEKVGHKKSIHLEPWPKYDPRMVKDEKISVAVQINGKLRTTIKMPADAPQAEAEILARKDVNVTRHLQGKTIRKIIYVKGKIINFVAN